MVKRIDLSRLAWAPPGTGGRVLPSQRPLDDLLNDSRFHGILNMLRDLGAAGHHDALRVLEELTAAGPPEAGRDWLAFPRGQAGGSAGPNRDWRSWSADDGGYDSSWIPGGRGGLTSFDQRSTMRGPSAAGRRRGYSGDGGVDWAIREHDREAEERSAPRTPQPESYRRSGEPESDDGGAEDEESRDWSTLYDDEQIEILEGIVETGGRFYQDWDGSMYVIYKDQWIRVDDPTAATMLQDGAALRQRLAELEAAEAARKATQLQDPGKKAGKQPSDPDAAPTGAAEFVASYIRSHPSMSWGVGPRDPNPGARPSGTSAPVGPRLRVGGLADQPLRGHGPNYFTQGGRVSYGPGPRRLPRLR